MPKPAPRHAVAASSSPNAAAWLCTVSQLMISSTMAARSATRPASKTVRSPRRLARPGPTRPALSRAEVTAVITCGTNISPYWLLDRS